MITLMMPLTLLLLSRSFGMNAAMMPLIPPLLLTFYEICEVQCFHAPWPRSHRHTAPPRCRHYAYAARAFIFARFFAIFAYAVVILIISPLAAATPSLMITRAMVTSGEDYAVMRGI